VTVIQPGAFGNAETLDGASAAAATGERNAAPVSSGSKIEKHFIDWCLASYVPYTGPAGFVTQSLDAPVTCFASCPDVA
jgi:hypothetical protein